MSFFGTPINLIRPSTSNGKKARQDYLREQPFFQEGGAKWDDSASNSAQVGDLFAFVHNVEDRMEVFRIIRVDPAINRPDYWDIPEHQRRNVIYLSEKVEEFRFSEYKTRVGYSPEYKLQGTTRLRW